MIEFLHRRFSNPKEKMKGKRGQFFLISIVMLSISILIISSYFVSIDESTVVMFEKDSEIDLYNIINALEDSNSCGTGCLPTWWNTSFAYRVNVTANETQFTTDIIVENNPAICINQSVIYNGTDKITEVMQNMVVGCVFTFNATVDTTYWIYYNNPNAIENIPSGPIAMTPVNASAEEAYSSCATSYCINMCTHLGQIYSTPDVDFDCLAGGDGPRKYKITFRSGGVYFAGNMTWNAPSSWNCTDSDSDGYNFTELDCGTADCNDGNTSFKPGATELCDGLDNDCDGSADEGLDPKWYADQDGDGFGNATNFTCSSSQPTGYISNTTDCNDGNSTVNPNGTELCLGGDEDCDDDASVFCLDTDCWDTNPGCEATCDDELDNDADSFFDCDDSDCDGRSCGNGCACSGGLKTETLCSDNIDNDQDTFVDCGDDDCAADPACS